jgi:hypothetical protein
VVSLSNERRQAVESLLNRLAGVRSAKVEIGADGEVEGVHIVSAGRFTAAQQARNVESALLAALDLTVDPDLITVVALEDQPSPAPQAPWRSGAVGLPLERRVRLGRLAFQQEGYRIKAVAELDWEGTPIRGAADDADTSKGRLQAAARATVAALENLLEGRAAYFLEGLESHATFERVVAVASLRVVSDTVNADLVGCAMVDEDPHHAAAQAVLAAANRSLTRLMSPGPSPAERARPQPAELEKGEARQRYALS